MSDENSYVEFKGYLQTVVFNKGDFRICGMNVDEALYPNVKRNKYGNVTIIGEMINLNPNVEYSIRAEESEGKYGFQYNVKTIRRDIPYDILTSKLFLSEIISSSQTDALLEKYPDIVKRVMDNDLSNIDLSNIKGVGNKTFERICTKIKDNFCLSDLITEFSKFFSINAIKKIYNQYSSVDLFKKKLLDNSYSCLCGIGGVGFKTADDILLKMSKNKSKYVQENLQHSLQRCTYYIEDLLNEAEIAGNTYMDLVVLRQKCMEDIDESFEFFDEAIKNELFYVDEKRKIISKKSTYCVEKYIADVIKNLVNSKEIWDIDIEKFRIVNGFNLSDEQMSALDKLCKNNIMILNGYAGCGKSFTTQAVLNMLDELNKSYLLLSPTGKASKVLSEYTNKQAFTIHRGLGYNPRGKEDDNWTYNEKNMLDEDVIIVDEFSMVDTFLFYRLLKAIDIRRTKLLIIGDNAQLTSVGCGNLLHDLMNYDEIAISTLTKVFRYSDGGLMTVATDVRNGKKYLKDNMKGCVTRLGSKKDYTFIDKESENIPSYAIAIFKKLLDSGVNIEDIQVLTAKNVGDCGTMAINKKIQKVANKNYGSKTNIETKDIVFYKDDLIIQQVNNYHAQVNDDSNSDYTEDNETFIANGETGKIIDIIDNKYAIIDFNGVVVKYDKCDLSSVKLGYCITIHKSQGSSIKNVILCTPRSHTFMLNSNLLYVGLTRMKDYCYHIGTLDSVNNATRRKANLQRNTNLPYLL